MGESSRTQTRKQRAFAVEAARLMADRHCDDVLLLDVRGLSQVCDYVLIGSGTSDRQMHSLAQELEELGSSHDSPVYRRSADQSSTWIVLDFVDLIVHLFEPGRRSYYDLEELWCDAETVPWQRQEAPRDAGPT